MEDSEKGSTRRLPPGPHGIPPELVERNQRERLISAMAEVSAERGYAGSSVADVAKRAGVSTASFYRQFRDRGECMLASFEELFGRLLEQIERACADESEPAAKARASAAAAAGLLAGDPPTARLLSIEILAVGSAGIRAQHEAIERMASMLRAPTVLPAQASPDAAWTVIAAQVALVGKRVAEGTSPSATELEALCGLL